MHKNMFGCISNKDFYLFYSTVPAVFIIDMIDNPYIYLFNTFLCLSLKHTGNAPIELTGK